VKEQEGKRFAGPMSKYCFLYAPKINLDNDTLGSRYVTAT